MIKEDELESTKNRNNRVISSTNQDSRDESIEKALRPKNFIEYIENGFGVGVYTFLIKENAKTWFI